LRGAVPVPLKETICGDVGVFVPKITLPLR
jgi:hypothetical protein